jgi:hypothetical protein
LGVIMRAEWLFLRPAKGKRFIASDAGRALLRHADNPDRLWFFVPLRHDIGVCIAQGAPSHQLHATREDVWVVGPFANPDVAEEHLSALNAAVAGGALSEIYGWPESLVREHHPLMVERPLMEWLEPHLTSVSGEARAHEDLHPQLAEYISTPPSAATAPFMPRMNLLSTDTSMKLYEFNTSTGPGPVAIPMQYRRLEVDGPIGPDGRPAMGEAQVAEAVSLAAAAAAAGERLEDIVFFRGQDGSMHRYASMPGLEFIDEQLAELKRPGCCVVIAGLDLERRQLAFGLLQMISLGGPYPIGDPPV